MQGGNTEYREELLKTGYDNGFYRMEITLKDNRASKPDRITTLSFTREELIKGLNSFVPEATNIEGYNKIRGTVLLGADRASFDFSIYTKIDETGFKIVVRDEHYHAVNTYGAVENIKLYSTADKYSIDGGSYQESNIFTGLSVGDYTIKAISSKGCESPEKTVSIVEPEDSVLVDIRNVVDVTCKGGVDGSIEALKTEGELVLALQGGNTEYTGELLKAGYVNDFSQMWITLKDRRYQERITTLSFTEDQLKNGGNGFTKEVTDIEGYNKIRGTVLLGSIQASFDFKIYTRIDETGFKIVVRDEHYNATNTYGAVEGIKLYSTYGNPNLLAGLSAGNYIVKARNSEGCESEEKEVNITEPDSVSISIDAVNVTCKGG